jgi:hypothetical protein
MLTALVQLAIFVVVRSLPGLDPKSKQLFMRLLVSHIPERDLSGSDVQRRSTALFRFVHGCAEHASIPQAERRPGACEQRQLPHGRISKKSGSFREREHLQRNGYPS